MNQPVHTLIFAHRGANKEAAENTRSAFEQALIYRIDGIETDIQLSRDAVPVLWHDRFMIKLRHPAKHIDDFDFHELQEMNFAAHFSSVAKPEGIMRLSDFLHDYRMRTHLLLEIKNRDWEERSRHENKVRQTLELVGAVADDRIMVSSFNLDSLVYAQHFKQGFPLVYNFEEYQTMQDAQQVLAAHPFLHGLCLPIAILDQSIVTLLRDAGKRIAVYTCNSDEEINRALELGVDILISDVPQKALLLRERKR
jgi:glycerophosphoryl diester phosphodiesterase